MGLFDDAKVAFNKAGETVGDALDKGVAVTKSAVSNVAVEQNAAVKQVARMCARADARGWHEANGGNVSLVLTEDQVRQCRSYFYTTPSSWVSLNDEAPEMAGAHLLVTGSGVQLRDVADDLVHSLGIVEISPTGNAWRIVWGLADGGMPTSELGAHLQIVAARRRVGETETSVVYHAHPANLIALTSVEAGESRAFTRALWKTLAECIIVAPRGVELLPWLAPGTSELAAACANALVAADAAVAVNHGVFAAAPSIDRAFNVVETLDKVAGVRLSARAASGGAEPATLIPDEGLRDIATRYLLPVREEWLASGEPELAAEA